MSNQRTVYLKLIKKKKAESNSGGQKTMYEPYYSGRTNEPNCSPNLNMNHI